MRKISFIMVIFLVVAILSQVTWATADVFVKVDGNLVDFPDAKPFIQTESSRTMIPIRFVAESMGADVQWVANARSVVIKKGSKTITLRIGNKMAVVNGKELNFDAAAIIVQDRTFVPLRFVMETLDASVNWEEKTRTVEIRTDIYEKGGFIIPNNCSIFISVDDDEYTSILLDLEENIGIEQQYKDLRSVLISKFDEEAVNVTMEYVMRKKSRNTELEFKEIYTKDRKYTVNIGSGAGNPSISVSIIKEN